ncbi:DUF2169 family type VI secretion system accessory protein [Polyangium jinanense]|uniref:DUF2169 domain-containing protein n=1 Tax=Polyangium jinanense TaxID=2829994 RepID=A0A9X3X2Q4_9BACT|nr:DUF2169 domain-containing protein [Polyangium jinanense]MDC3957232.1 DUF2169 domain-containing protein [Polyangium jinanense]MDC3982634.1 DUF2169 domain-containing protein [Polyangium jinanense]
MDGKPPLMLRSAHLPAVPEPQHESTTASTAVAWRFEGQLHVTVIAKATFTFAPDAPMSRTEPQEILRSDVHHGNNPARSVRFTSDLAPYLARADVLFTGHAYAPEGNPVQALPVRVAIFDDDRLLLDKRLLIRAPRGLQRMPMVYERSTRGMDGQENPFGLEPPTDEQEPYILDPTEPHRPAGFGPIGRAWPIRKRLLGSVPRHVLDGPIAEIPEGFNWSYFQAAPLDQRIDWLRGDEWLVLEGLHPALPRFRTRLPGLRGAARVFGLSAFGVPDGQPLDLHLDTVRIDGDEQRCTVVCRRSFPIASEAALSALRIVAAVQMTGEESISRIEPTPSRNRAGCVGATQPTTTLALSSDAAAAAKHLPLLPFVPPPVPSGAPTSGTGAALGQNSVPREQAPSTGTLALVPEENEAAATRSVMPFRAAAPSPPIIEHVSSPPPPAPTPVEPPIEQGQTAAAPAPPPMIGPLAGSEMVARTAVLPEPPQSSTESKDLPLEKCAAIAAAIACHRAETTEILRENGLGPMEWAALERRWMDAIRTETSKGKPGLLRRFDAAYVDQIEKERGPIQASEYARLTLASEQGAIAEALSALSLPQGAAMRIERVWVERLAQDRALRKHVRDALKGLQREGTDAS